MRLAQYALLATVPVWANEVNVLVKSSVAACSTLVANESWEFAGADYYGAMCEYEPAFGSWATCIDDFIQESGIELVAGVRVRCIENMNHRCHGLDNFQTTFTEEQFLASIGNASQYVDNGSVARHTGREPVRFPADARRSLGRAWVINLRNLDASNASSQYLYGFLAAFAILAAIFHHWNMFVFQRKTINKARSWLTLPTLLHKHAQPLRQAPGGLLPTRLELGIVVGFLLAHTLALCYNYEFDGDEVMESRRMQLLKFIGYRTGLLAFAQCPLLVFFSGRNSMFELVTGLHYSTSIVLHKWISRLMTFDAFLHGAIFILRAYWGGYLEHAKKSHFWICGAATLYASIFLCLLAFGMLRHRFYEFFLVTHIVLAVAFFYYAWQHVKSLGWTGWVYVSVGLWVAEKTLRGIRILSFGGVKCSRVELYEPDLMRVTIAKPHMGWTTHPGEYAFIYFLFPTTWWQSHPFSFVDRGDSIVVVIKAKKGVTSTLLTKVKQSGGVLNVPVCVEGPYGDSATVSGFDGKLFVCGGSGIPGPLSYVLNTPKPRMLLVIVVRDLDILHAFETEILSLPESSVHIYITTPSTEHQSINDPVWDQRKNAVRGRRPDIAALVHEFFDTSESLAITCCGPPALVDMTRDISAKALYATPAKCMAYFEEYQTW